MVLRRGVSWAWLSVALLAVLLAILVTLLRFGSPWLANWQQDWLARQLNDQQLTLEIGELGVSWQDYGPVLVVNQVSLHQEQAPPITLRRALVDMQLWQSIRQWRPVLNELTLDGLRVPMVLDSHSDAPPMSIDWSSLRHLVLEGVEQFSLQDGQLIVSSPDKDLIELHLPDLHWQNKPGLHQGQGRLGFGSAAQQQLQLNSYFIGSSDKLSGHVYMQADNVDATEALSLIRPQDKAVTAKVNFELWLEWQQGQLNAGVLEFGDNRFGWGEQHNVAVKGGRLQWQPTDSGWQLASSNIDISVDDEIWPSWQLQLDKHNGRLQGYLNRLTFTDLALLAQWGESFWPEPARQLAGIAPQGELTKLYFSADSNLDHWRWQGELEDISTQAFEWAPSTQGVNGHFSVSATQGQLSVQQDEAANWTFDNAFRAAWPMQRLAAKVQWQKQAEGWTLWSRDLEVDTDDLTLQGWFSLLLPKQGTPLLSASARVDVLRAEQAFRYFPEPVMGSELVDYLQGAIKGGQAKGAEVLWYGRPLDFPYHDNSGIFHARVPLRQAQFQFDPEWQALSALSLDLLFENDGLYMQGDTGRLGQVNASNIDARIVPLDEDGILELSANINGKGEAVTDYLQHSSLASSVGITLEQIQVAGPLNGQLALSIPLNGGEVAVNGQVDFLDNKVRVKPLDLPLQAVSGRLVFDEQQTHFKAMKAQWHQQPLQLDYNGQQTPDSYQVQLDITGQLQAAKLSAFSPALSELSGKSDWQGQLDLTLPNQGPVSYQFRANSALTGLGSALPAPLNKKATQAKHSELTVTGDIDNAQLQLNVGPHIRGQAKLAFTKAGPQVERLWLSAGVNTRPHSAPLDIAINQPDMVLDDWVSLFNQLQAAPVAANSTAANGIRWPSPYRIDVQASRAQLWQQPFNQLSLLVEPQGAHRHQLHIQSEQAQGQVLFGGAQALQAHFSRLWLGQKPAVGQETSEKSEIDVAPEQIPALAFSCDDCRWQKLALGKLNFSLQSEPNKVLLTEFDLDGPLLHAQAQGQWLQEDQVNLSRLEWQSNSPSLERLWKALGNTSPFSDTSAKLSGQLRWLDVPWRPELAQMNGSLAMNTGAGVLRDINDKGAGLLSVISLESLMRRLRLDFRDVYAQGFYFDRISATGELNNGVLQNNDLLLKGAAGNLRGQGQLDFASEQLDYQFELVPNLTGNLPAIAAFAVTPVAGLYVLALSKVLGPVVDVFTRIRYQVSGPLAKPKVTELGRDKKRVTVPE
ncbi:TIGR02099 family protein [Oceanisphaera sp. DM8]|uniref:TIGR02099 family protein n=1 Tax=Oceanisphaera pacifica TaxID=2818389 RepID=A0ABS3NII7_9GAMM|nr:TIGR02099 family protein [Oceanisphaera pacifica]